MRTFAVTLALTLLAACSKPPSQPTPPEPTDEQSKPAEELPDVDSGSERPGITADACEAEGGTVVGDIGDGAIHRPDYLCPDSGEPPIGTITANPEGPVAIEGAVCC